MCESEEALVTVSCREHHDMLAGGLWNLFTSQHDVDYELELEGHSIQAHQLVLEVFLPADKLSRMSDHQQPEMRLHSDLEMAQSVSVPPSDLETSQVDVMTSQVDMMTSHVDVTTSQVDVMPSQVDIMTYHVDSKVDIPGQPDVKLDVATGSGCLYALLEFLYTGRVSVRRSLLDPLRRMAERLDFHLLASAVLAVLPDSGSGAGEGGTNAGPANDVGAVTKMQEDVAFPDAEDELDSDDLLQLDSEWDLSEGGEGQESDGSDWLTSGRGGRAKGEGRQGRAQKLGRPTNPSTKVSAPHPESSGTTTTSSSIKRGAVTRATTSVRRAAKRSVSSPAGRRRTGQPTRTYRCERCEFTSTGSWKYRHHLNTVHGVTTRGEPFQELRCPDCPYKAIDRNQLKYHAVRHTNDKPFKCAHCPYASGLKGCIVRHTAIVHPDTLPGGAVEPPRLLKCPHCDRFQTYKKRTYDHHLYSVHRLRTNGEPLPGPHYTCDVCQYECVNASILKNHQLTKHSGLTPYRCPHCTYATSRKGRLGQHVRQVHLGLKPYMCESCGHRAPSAVKLEQHRQVHTEARPYTCDICGQTYKDQGSFKRHVRRHVSDERPHVCHVCSRAFNRLSNLKVHLRNVHKQGAATGADEPPHVTLTLH